MTATLLFALLTVGASASQPARSPELARRADSLAALNPEREARAALARGDRRLIAVCGYACGPPGVEITDSVVALRKSWRVILGTSDAVANDDMRRLNRVAGEYAARYNRVVLPPRGRVKKESHPAI